MTESLQFLTVIEHSLKQLRLLTPQALIFSQLLVHDSRVLESGSTQTESSHSRPGRQSPSWPMHRSPGAPCLVCVAAEQAISVSAHSAIRTSPTAIKRIFFA